MLHLKIWSGDSLSSPSCDSIQDRMDKAVASADQGEAVIINLATDCRQDVVITGNDVTIRTSPSVSRVRLKGTITVFSERNIITGNAFAAVSVSSLGVFQNSQAVPGGDPKAKDRDVYTQRGCAQGNGPGCGGGGTAVISVSTRGLVELHNAFVTGIVLVRGVSNLEMDTSIMFGEVQGFDRSGFNIKLSVSGDGRLVCNSDAFAYGVASYFCGEQFATRSP